MREILMFTDKTPKAEEVHQRFVDMERECLDLSQTIAILEARQKDAEITLGVLGTEGKKHISAYQESLADEANEKASAIATGLDKIRGETFKRENEIEGIKKNLAIKRERLAALQESLKEKEYLLALSELYPLYDRYNELAPTLGGIIQEMIRAFRKARDAAQKCGIRIERHIDLDDTESFPHVLPKIFFDRSKSVFDKKPTRSEANFWHYEAFLEEERAAARRARRSLENALDE